MRRPYLWFLLGINLLAVAVNVRYYDQVPNAVCALVSLGMTIFVIGLIRAAP